MNTKAFAIFAIAAMFAVCVVPFNEASADISDVSGDLITGVSDSADYTITYSNHDHDDKKDMSMSISYNAKLIDAFGETVSNGVSPSTGDIDNGISTTVTVKAPKTAGDYKLVVTYDVDITYTDDEGETKEESVSARSSTVNIEVVEPITLSVTLKNASEVGFDGFGVYFYIDGKKMDDSYTTVNMSKDGTATVTYKWVAAPSEGEHTFSVNAAESGTLVQITGLGEEQKFFIGDSSYTWFTALLVVLIVVLAIVMVWIYRKPVKNYGKPKSRR